MAVSVVCGSGSSLNGAAADDGNGHRAMGIMMKTVVYADFEMGQGRDWKSLQRFYTPIAGQAQPASPINFLPGNVKRYS